MYLDRSPKSTYKARAQICRAIVWLSIPDHNGHQFFVPGLLVKKAASLRLYNFPSSQTVVDWAYWLQTELRAWNSAAEWAQQEDGQNCCMMLILGLGHTVSTSESWHEVTVTSFCCRILVPPRTEAMQKCGEEGSKVHLILHFPFALRV